MEIGNVYSHDVENVWIHGDGWISGSGIGDNTFSYKQNDNPLGPSFASCLGSSILFQRAISENVRPHQSWHDLFTLQYDPTGSNFLDHEFPKTLDLGSVHQIGCGAVGSSLDYLISFTDAKGKFVLIDSDVVDYSNCNRSLSFSAYDADAVEKPPKKTDNCENSLLNSGLYVESYTLKYADFTSRYTDKTSDVDLVLCLANEDNIWSSIQSQFPPITLHATTTSSWGVNFGRHIPISEWCILCRFASDLQNTFVPPCETAKIKQSENNEIQGVLPFLSPAAAVLLLAEIAKLNEQNYPLNENFIEYSIQNPFFRILSQKKPKAVCTCQSQSSGIYKKYRAGSKFWKNSKSDW